ncbi:MAG: biopolymer transporter ExbD [Candidatus Hydrogenedentes bacterium]|nr:biopolymer transporter ExbD [Candidatus Hydrogenedentota bacterium]
MQVASGGSKRRRPVFNEINITPLTDIFLVLLIIMMVVAPALTQARRDIKPPVIEGGGGLDQRKLTVEVTKDGECYADGKAIAVDNLEAFLKGKSETTKQSSLIVQADRLAKNKMTMKVYEAAQNAGFNEITIAGQALPESRAKELEELNKKPDEAAAP